MSHERHPLAINYSLEMETDPYGNEQQPPSKRCYHISALLLFLVACLLVGVSTHNSSSSTPKQPPPKDDDKNSLSTAAKQSYNLKHWNMCVNLHDHGSFHECARFCRPAHCCFKKHSIQHKEEGTESSDETKRHTCVNHRGSTIMCSNYQPCEQYYKYKGHH